MLSTLAPVIQTLLALVGGLLPTLGVNGSSVAARVISALENIVPVLAANASPLLTEVQSIIAALRNGSTPLAADQLAALDALDAQIDAQFEADATAAGLPAPSAAPAAPSSP